MPHRFHREDPSRPGSQGGFVFGPLTSQQAPAPFHPFAKGLLFFCVKVKLVRCLPLHHKSLSLCSGVGDMC
jgi:hypothetical protein